MKNFVHALIIYLGIFDLSAQSTNAVEIITDLDQDLELEVKHPYTNIEIIGHAEQKILIEMYKGMFGNSVKNPPIKYIEDNDRLMLTHSNSWTKNYSMKIWIPTKSSATVDAEFASTIKVSGITGNVNINSHSADVEVDKIDGNIDINTFDGDIIVSELIGSPLLYTNNGNILISFAEPPNAYPNIITSMYGNIELYLDSETGALFRFKMEQNFDRIKSDFLMKIIPASKFPMSSESRNNYYRQINGGGAPIYIRTFRGKVAILDKKKS